MYIFNLLNTKVIFKKTNRKLTTCICICIYILVLLCLLAFGGAERSQSFSLCNIVDISNSYAATARDHPQHLSTPRTFLSLSSSSWFAILVPTQIQFNSIFSFCGKIDFVSTF